MNKIYYLGLAIILLSANTSLGQSAPPPMAAPDKNNTLLIDKIIEITDHEQYFVDYCTKKVKRHGAENNWSEEKTKEILGSIRFKYYNSTIYNSFAFYSTGQLQTLVNALEALRKDKQFEQPFILTNSMMQNNLELFVENLIDGKYLTKKNK